MPDPILANVGQRAAQTTNIALLGFGTVGSSFAEVLAAAGRPDIRITHVFNRGVDRKRSHGRAQFLASRHDLDGEHRRHTRPRRTCIWSWN